jgi:hypothetical protein
MTDERPSTAEIQRCVREWEKAKKADDAYRRLLAYGAGLVAHLDGRECVPPPAWPSDLAALFTEGWRQRDLRARPGHLLDETLGK